MEINKNKQTDLDISQGFMSRFRHKTLNMYYTRESPGKIVDFVSCHYDMVDMSSKVPSSLDGVMRTAPSVMCLPCVMFLIVNATQSTVVLEKVSLRNCLIRVFCGCVCRN